MSTVMTDDAGAVRIVLGGGGAARLFGVPFLIVGAWLGWFLVLNLRDFVMGRAGAELIVGTLPLAVVTAAAFLVPGWLLVASRAIVEIDCASGTVTAVRDLRLYRHRSVRRLSEFASLEVDVLSVAPNPSRRSRTGYQVELAAMNAKNQVIGLFDDSDEALAHGRRLGALLGLPVKDRRFTDSPPDE